MSVYSRANSRNPCCGGWRESWDIQFPFRYASTWRYLPDFKVFICRLWRVSDYPAASFVCFLLTSAMTVWRIKTHALNTPNPSKGILHQIGQQIVSVSPPWATAGTLVFSFFLLFVEKRGWSKKKSFWWWRTEVEIRWSHFSNVF